MLFSYIPVIVCNTCFWFCFVLFFFIESLLSLKKSRLLQLLDSKESELRADPPETFDDRPGLNDSENDTVSNEKC